MHALLLAAGVGSRLRPYTDETPKPMLPVGGRPILGYNLALLAAAGFDDVAINLHYLPTVVRTYAGDGAAWNVRVRYSEEPELLGTAGALVPLADDFARGTFAVVYGDNLNDLDLGAMLRLHRARGAVATVALYARDDVTSSGVAELSDDDRIRRFVEKPRPGESASHWVNAGVVIAEPALLELVPRARPSDLGRDVLPVLAARGTLFGYRMSGGHWWFDRTADYERALDDETLAAFVASRAR
ncbi:MAG TPA: nucleotidyltransferase family protein [Candidatus Elarobacter sp.]|jgi:mannose-1-phosphate guanylyltransferase/mannose-1-phosphate guanylyltransferase/phosphomannomutase|nr:nucleotidyltransferase family protein [Candidatus Elarobacter sp.]